MSAFYGVYEESPAHVERKPTPRVEPVDDPRFLLNTSVPERNFGDDNHSCRFTRGCPHCGSKKKIENDFGGVDFEAVLKS